jgi:hypothetical protein
MGEPSDRIVNTLSEVKKVIGDIRIKISKYALNLPFSIGDISLYLEIIQKILGDIDDIIDSAISKSVEAVRVEEIDKLDAKIKDLSVKINLFVDKLLINPTSSPDSRFYIQMILDGLKRLKELLIERDRKLKKE